MARSNAGAGMGMVEKDQGPRAKGIGSGGKKMSLTDVGVNFKMTGAESLESRLRAMESSFRGVSKAVDNNAIGAKLDTMTGHFERMHNGVNRWLRLTAGSITAFLTGKAVTGLANWIMGGSGAAVDQNKDFLRFKGMSDQTLKILDEHYKALSKTRQANKEEYFDMYQQIGPILRTSDPELLKRGGQAAYDLKYSLFGNKGTPLQAANFARPIVSGYGATATSEQRAELLERTAAYAAYTTEKFGVTGHDLEMIIQQLAGPYAASGKSKETLFAHAGLVGEIVGVPGGEALKGLLSKEGTAFGELITEAEKQKLMSRIQAQDPSIRSMADLPEEMQQAINREMGQAKTHYAAQGGRMLAEGNIAGYYAEIQKALAEIRQLSAKTGVSPGAVISQSFGETAMKALGTLAQAEASGKVKAAEKEMQGIDPSQLTQKINEAQKSLGIRAITFEQQLGNFSSELRRVFEPMAVSMLQSWEKSLTDIRAAFTGADGGVSISQQLGEFIRGLSAGWAGPQAELQGISAEIAPLRDRLRNFLSGINADSGKAIGDAANQFAAAAKQFAWIVGALYKVVSLNGLLDSSAQKKEGTVANAVNTLGGIAGAAAGYLGSAAIGAKSLFARGIATAFGYNVGTQTAENPWAGAWAGGILGGLRGGSRGGAWGALSGALGGAAMGSLGAPLSSLAPENEPSLFDRNMMPPRIADAWDAWRLSGSPGASEPTVIQSKPEVTNNVEISVDGEKLADAVTSRVWTKMQENIQMERDRNWKNSMDYSGF